MSERVTFTAMKDGTKEDYALLERLEKPFLALTADRVLDELRRAGEATLEGYQITRLDHGLQSGTRALRAGADLDWVVGALLHDVGDGLAPQNHDRMSAEVIRPCVRWEVSWTVEHHGLFPGGVPHAHARLITGLQDLGGLVSGRVPIVGLLTDGWTAGQARRIATLHQFVGDVGKGFNGRNREHQLIELGRSYHRHRPTDGVDLAAEVVEGAVGNTQ